MERSSRRRRLNHSSENLIIIDSLSVFFQLYNSLRSYGDFNSLILAALIQLAALRGNIFANGQAMATFMSNYLKQLLPLMRGPSVGIVEIKGFSQVSRYFSPSYNLDRFKNFRKL
jgi:hypothetical protein